MKFWLEILCFVGVICLILFTRIPVPIVELWVKSFIVFLFAFCLGLKVSDVDLYTRGLVHRSILTHSVLIPLLLLYTGKYAVVSGLALGMSIHLLADSFPKAWVGGALINVPWYGSIGRWSPWWLMTNSVLCLILGVMVLPKISEWFCFLVFFITGLSAMWYMLKKEQSLESALVVLLVIGVLVWARCGDLVLPQIQAWLVKHPIW